MKTCWEILGIEASTEVVIIRQAYLALLPSFHPETDPQGFKQLRRAYEDAIRCAESSVNDVLPEPGSQRDEHALMTIFRTLLGNERERFLPQAWQRFIHQLNDCSMGEVDDLRWKLCAEAMGATFISFRCLRLLAERLQWWQQDADESLDEDDVDAFLRTIKRGDLFDFSTLSHLPAALQNQTIEYFVTLDRLWRTQLSRALDYLEMHTVMFIPDDEQLQYQLLRWYTSLGWDMPELLAYARAWHNDQAGNADAAFYEYSQRVNADEGESLLPELCQYWQQSPSTQADNLLLKWCRQHRPDVFPLVTVIIEAREMVDEDGNPLIYVTGENARTRLQWAQILHSGLLSSTAGRFVEQLLSKRRVESTGKLEEFDLLWVMYCVTEQLVCAKRPDEAYVLSMLHRLDSGDCDPLEALIVRGLLQRAAAEGTVVRVSTVNESTHEDSATGCLPVLKMLGFMLLVLLALSRIVHFLH
ncbi:MULTISPECIES: J domain-containing protein [Enterobacterales]|uniref:J domain-containing protein n=1 Tax=Enterobacterales TaxID=91347 RepID=UPI002EDA452B